jgi:hypothetical protein
MKLTPHTLSPEQTAERNKLVAWGFVFDATGAADERGTMWWRAVRVCNGISLDFSVALTTGEIRMWGTLETWTRETAAAAFAPGPVDDAERYLAAGFIDLKEQPAEHGLPCKYYALRADGTRWLLNPNTRPGQCILLSRRPTTVWHIVPVGDTLRLQKQHTTELWPLPPPAVTAAAPAADGRKRPQFLF